MSEEKKSEVTEDNKELRELKDDELEQVTGGINPPTMFDNSVPLKKTPIAQTGKINELIKTGLKSFRWDFSN